MFKILVLFKKINDSYEEGDVITMLREGSDFGKSIDYNHFRVLTIDGEYSEYLIEELYFEFPAMQINPCAKPRRYFLRIDEITKDELTLEELETYLEEKPLPDHTQKTDMVI